MHKKLQGTLGEIAVTKNLIEQGYSVFMEVGDISKVDLITIVDNRPVKVQVKCPSKINNVYELSFRKVGPNYTHYYVEDEIDIFAVYCMEEDVVMYINSDILKTYKSSMNFRAERTKYSKNSNIIFDYTDFRKALSQLHGA